MGNSGRNIHITSLLAWIALHWNMEKIRGSDQQYQQYKKMGDATIPLIIIRIPISISVGIISVLNKNIRRTSTGCLKRYIENDLWKVYKWK